MSALRMSFMWLSLLMIMAAAGSECNSAECKDDNLETAALVQSKLSMKSREVAQQKETPQREQAVEQEPEDPGDELEDGADEEIYDDEEEDGEPDIGATIVNLPQKDESATTKSGEPELAVDFLLEKTQRPRKKKPRWLVYFAEGCTDKGWKQFCSKHSCKMPKVKPSRTKAGEAAAATIKASKNEIRKIKKEGLHCTIDKVQKQKRTR